TAPSRPWAEQAQARGPAKSSPASHSKVWGLAFSLPPGFARRWSPLAFALTLAISLPAADFMGSQACAACHPSIYRSYMATPMAHSSGRVGTSETKDSFDRGEFRDSRNAYAYRVGQEAGAYFFEFTQQHAAQPVQG